jgi:beta-phosphoglucomutase-like phosphatase (HAD superfamily)
MKTRKTIELGAVSLLTKRPIDFACCVGRSMAVAGVEAARAGDFGLVIGVGSTARAPELLEHGADAVVADLGEVQFEGTVASPRGI